MLATFSLSGCYLMQAAQGQLAISAKRELIEKVVAAPETPTQLRTRLQLIAQAREFASRELGLPDNPSYRSFVDLKRDFAVWNVFATERFSVEPRRWCFPIAGCVVYRGYFKEQTAQRYARHQRLRGGDATVAGAAAYSTLGHFDDPVVSSMLRWSDAQIAATLFHELTHQVLYVPNESDFNEAFASVVEEEGAQRWLESRNDSAAFAAWRASRSRGIEFTELLLTARERLRKLYTESSLEPDLYYRKQQEFGRLKYDYWQLKASWNGYAGYDAWFDRALSNADLVSAATYQSCVPGLTQLLDSVNRDLPKFYAAAKALDVTARRKICGT
jgi:predicted aminopeptidase